MVSGLQPRRRDAAKTTRSLCKECRNCNIVGLQTAVGYFLFRWRQSRATDSIYLLRVLKLHWPLFAPLMAKPGPRGLCCGSWNCRWPPRLAEGKAGPKDFATLCVPGLETAVGRCSFHWRHGLARVCLLGVLQLPLGTFVLWGHGWAQTVTGPETAVGHLSFDWGVKPAPRSRSAEGKAGPTEWRMTACCSTEGTAGPKRLSLLRVLKLQLATFRSTETAVGHVWSR